jgi:aspartyl-tRNA(Asn)/glutamyl-tRNA(Gln) amidotransferase subunit B
VSLVPTIGLEVHCQLATQTKMFCACPVLLDAPPNSAVCPVCLGHPGALPVVNDAAVRLGIRAGLALGSTIHHDSVFARKHYFYPDLPKGYQISQFDRPLCTGGQLHVLLAGERSRFEVHRIHLEEDAGKMRHTDDGSRVDWNRGGTPLVEIVGEPDLHSPEQAGAWFRMLHRVMVRAGVTIGDMDKGHFRCDANVSLAEPGAALGTRVELKNINSFRFVERALHTEITRQRAVLEGGGRIVQATRTWVGDQTVLLRSKEEAADYRYFPDPDLPVLQLTEVEIDQEAAALPGSPLDLYLLDQDAAQLDVLSSQHGLRPTEAQALLARPELHRCFQAAVTAGGAPEAMLNWLMGPVSAQLKSRSESLGQSRLQPAQLVALEGLVVEGSINRGTARTVLQEVMLSGEDPAAVVAAQGLSQVADSAVLGAQVTAVLAAHPEEAARLQAGERKLLGFFVGQVMRASGGRADPQAVRTLVEAKLLGQ